MRTQTLVLPRTRLYNLAGIIPPALVPTARAYLASQGITQSAVTDAGDVDPQAIIALVYDSVEFRSRLFPAGKVSYNLKDTTSSPQTRALLKFVQPAVILRSAKLGDRVLFAPAGVPTEVAPEISKAATNIGIGVGAAALGLVVLGAVVAGRKRR